LIIQDFIYKEYIEENVGVLCENGYSYTDLERTLIDIAIRPAYSGGVFEVLQAFESARDIVDVVKMNEYLVKLNYIYPYHQLIGFYMERAGYNIEIVDDVFYNDIVYDFYLTYNMSNKEFDTKWKIYFPKGF
jgi:predicted transcriptional regulator of viral defense system